jgi:hypothetical protein
MDRCRCDVLDAVHRVATPTPRRIGATQTWNGAEQSLHHGAVACLQGRMESTPSHHEETQPPSRKSPTVVPDEHPPGTVEDRMHVLRFARAAPNIAKRRVVGPGSAPRTPWTRAAVI